MASALCNGPADGSASPELLARAGVKVLRLVPLLQYDLTRYLDELTEHGIDLLWVLDHDVLGDDPNLWGDRWIQVRDRYPGKARVAQVANEADQPGSGSSWFMDPKAYGKLLLTLRPLLGMPLIGSGLVSGDPNWLRRVPIEALRAVDFHAVHPYGQRAEPDWPNPNWGFGYVGDLIRNYRQVLLELSLPGNLWITEVGFSSQPLRARQRLGSTAQERADYRGRHVAHPNVLNIPRPPGGPLTGLAARNNAEDFQADYCERMMATLARDPGIMVGGWFCWHGYEGFGLVDPEGRAKPALAAYTRASALFDGGGSVPVPVPPESPPTGSVVAGPGGEWIGAGLLQGINNYGAHPLGGEVQGNGFAWVPCLEGVLYWTAATGLFTWHPHG